MLGASLAGDASDPRVRRAQFMNGEVLPLQLEEAEQRLAALCELQQEGAAAVDCRRQLRAVLHA